MHLAKCALNACETSWNSTATAPGNQIFHLFFFFFVCLVGGFRPTLEFFTHFETSPLPAKSCKCWPKLGNYDQGAVRIHNYCYTRHMFLMVISDNPWHSHLMTSVRQWSCYYVFLRLRYVPAGIRTPNLPLASRTL